MAAKREPVADIVAMILSHAVVDEEFFRDRTAQDDFREHDSESPRSAQIIQRKVKLQNVDPRFAEKAKLAALDVLLDQPANGFVRKMPRFSHGMHLVERRCWGYLWINARSGCLDQIDRHKLAGVLLLICSDGGVDPI